jgi:hypothetical protein
MNTGSDDMLSQNFTVQSSSANANAYRLSKGFNNLQEANFSIISGNKTKLPTLHIESKKS